MGCPFCARVEWILRFYGVPFDTVDVDTLSGKGIPDSRYTSVPQIKLASVADNHSISPDSLALDGDSVYVVDSQCIISALAAPLQFGGQLKDARVSKTRQWIVNRFQTVSFLATSSQWTNAYVTHPLVTPARYHNAVFRVVGASAVYLLARWEIAPAFVKRCSESGGDVGTLRELLRKDPCALLEEELVTFTSNLQGTSARRFHGGDKPDIADVEMFAVTRIIEAHPVLRDVLHKGVLGGWSAAMEREMQERVRT
ncbi:hypothetical protein TRVL_04789 [Trypanosoma vivax]|nr:hypothetical protein TRVL_04789 [Trypanosoma vivax]